MANTIQTPVGVINKAVPDTAGSRAYDTKYGTYLDFGASNE